MATYVNFKKFSEPELFWPKAYVRISISRIQIQMCAYSIYGKSMNRRNSLKHDSFLWLLPYRVPEAFTLRSLNWDLNDITEGGLVKVLVKSM